MTLAGVIAQSSNIGTVLASRNFETGQLREYLTKFGLGQKTDVGIAGETQGILPDPSIWTSMTQDRIAFGQSLSVNALQMAAAVNTVANGGVRVSPSLIRGTAVTDDGLSVGTDTATTERVISKRAAHQTALMMERVVDPDAGVAPAAQVPGYRVAGKTGHRSAGGAEVRLLQRHLHRLLRGLRTGRQPPLHRVRRGAEPPQRRRRRLGRRPGVRQDHELRAASLRRPAHRLARRRRSPPPGGPASHKWSVGGQ